MSQYRFCLFAGMLMLALSAFATPIRFGVALPRQVTSATDISTTCDAARQAGVRSVRIFVDWAQIQPKSTDWNFTRLDVAVQAAEARRMPVTLVFGAPPRWAVTYLGPNPSSEEVARAHPNLSAYSKFVAGVAKRYKQRVYGYQAWSRPTSSTLLALPADVYAMYQAAARAVHGVDPALRVVVSEPGDVDLAWADEYLRVAQGAARADALILVPVRCAKSPRTFAWRIQALRQMVMARQGTIPLWVDIPTDADGQRICAPMASIALMEGITDLFVTPAQNAASSALLAASGISFFTALQDMNCVGWSTLAPNVIGGTFTGQSRTVILAQALADSAIHLVSSEQPVTFGVAVPGSHAIVSSPSVPERAMAVGEVSPLAITVPEPMLLSGVLVKPTRGEPDMRPAPITTAAVSLDTTGSNPAGIQLLRQFPGGQFNQYTIEGRLVVSTVRDDEPWIHLDIPDGFLFYNTARTPVEVTVQVLGVATRQRTGFNLYYDAIGSMSSTSWQWIDTGTSKVYTYTFRINDGLFSGREGYDFRINMGGSDENVRVVGVTVKKLPAH